MLSVLFLPLSAFFLTEAKTAFSVSFKFIIFFLLYLILVLLWVCVFALWIIIYLNSYSLLRINVFPLKWGVEALLLSIHVASFFCCIVIYYVYIPRKLHQTMIQLILLTTKHCKELKKRKNSLLYLPIWLLIIFYY